MRKAQKKFLPLQLGDVPDTFADIEYPVNTLGFGLATEVNVGVEEGLKHPSVIGHLSWTLLRKH